MRVPRSPASWGCLGSSAERGGGGRAGVSAGRGVLVLSLGGSSLGSAQGSQVTRTERGSTCDLQGRLVCQARVWPENGVPLTQCHPCPPAGLPPRWYHWRWTVQGLAWGSRRPPRPGLHNCSPGRERTGMDWREWVGEVPSRRGRFQGRQVPCLRVSTWALAIYPSPRPEPARGPQGTSMLHSSQDQRGAWVQAGRTLWGLAELPIPSPPSEAFGTALPLGQ